MQLHGTQVRGVDLVRGARDSYACTLFPRFGALKLHKGAQRVSQLFTKDNHAEVAWGEDDESGIGRRPQGE